jgi:hypothetical protein
LQVRHLCDSQHRHHAGGDDQCAVSGLSDISRLRAFLLIR